MRGSAPSSHQELVLVFDIGIGYVRSLLLRNHSIVKQAHKDIPFYTVDIVPTFLSSIETLLQESVEALGQLPQNTKVATYIQAPLSYTTQEEVIFSPEDSSFLETRHTIVYEGDMHIPVPYKNILQAFATDGVYIQHPPYIRKINGYQTKNITYPGERSATLSQQWVQSAVFNALERIRVKYRFQTIIFLLPTLKNHLHIGEYVSTLHIENTPHLLGIGYRSVVSDTATELDISHHQVVDTLRAITRGHIPKEKTYRTAKKIVDTSLEKLLRFIGISVTAPYLWTCTKDEYGIHTIVQDALSDHKNITITETDQSEIMHIIKNALQ